ncbi:MAG TPA: hypothetical protein VK571_09135 [Gemmatimonadaceae bacterium]|nr:hypothetical protein [Gemmatimonadaceae bacterium]
MTRRGGHPGRRAPVRHAVFPRTVVVEPTARCCACCGNYCDDATCVHCGLGSRNAGESSSSSSPAAASDVGKAQGAAAGVGLVVLAILLSQHERLFS